MKYNTRFTIYDMCAVGIFTAIISILSQIAIPMPSGIPFTLQTFAIILTAIILGSKKGTLAVLIYLLLGSVGIPVFSHFRGGLQAFVSPTGGFLISFPVLSFVVGYGSEIREKKWVYPFLLIIGTMINYLAGMVLYCFSTESNFSTAFLVCVLPFLPTTIITAALASVLGFKIRQRLPIL